jgi:hypothetical protein
VTQIPSEIPSLILISLGPDYGILSINGMFKHGPGISRDKYKYMENARQVYSLGNLAVH